MAERIFKDIATQDLQRPALSAQDVSAGFGQPRVRLTLTRHPELGWYLYLTFSPL